MEIPQELIARCIKGDRMAEFELYKALYSFMMGICRRYVRQNEKARELMNLGFYRVLTNLAGYRPEAPFVFWVRRILINTMINEHKREKLHYGNHSYVESYHDSQAFSEINSALEKLDNDAIRNCIDRLPPASRQVFNMYFIDGLRHSEIAGLLKISEGTSKWHLKVARDKLRTMIGKMLTKTGI